MNANELSEILHKHSLWLNDDPGGKKANLSRVDLRGADLSIGRFTRS